MLERLSLCAALVLAGCATHELGEDILPLADSIAKDDPAAAIPLLEAVWNDQPGDPEVRARLAVCYEELTRRRLGGEDWAGALDACQSWTRHAPDSYRAYVQLGVCHYQLREYDRELAAYRKAIAINPSSRDAFRRLGFALHALDRREEASRVYEHYLRRFDPSDPLIRYNLELLNPSPAERWRPALQSPPERLERPR